MTNIKPPFEIIILPDGKVIRTKSSKFIRKIKSKQSKHIEKHSNSIHVKKIKKYIPITNIIVINNVKDKNVKDKNVKDKNVKDKNVKDKNVKDKNVKDKNVKDKNVKDNIKNDQYFHLNTHADVNTLDWVMVSR
jgi:hypothetical protein